MTERRFVDTDVPRFAKLFDHSIVRPDATRDQVRTFADTAAQLGTATLTVQPHYIGFAAQLLRASGVLVGTVVGFPHGNETSSMKERQAEEVLDLDAEEIDMVMNITKARPSRATCQACPDRRPLERPNESTELSQRPEVKGSCRSTRRDREQRGRWGRAPWSGFVLRTSAKACRGL